MPKAPKTKANKGRKGQKTGYLPCTCKCFCLTNFNELTGQFEPKQVYVAPATRVRHRRFERLYNLLQEGPGGAPPLPPNPDNDDEDPATSVAAEQRWIELLSEQQQAFERLPVLHPGQQLQFVLDPLTAGPFQAQLSELDLDEDLYPSPLLNAGPHALDPSVHSNKPFLEREKMLWETWRTLRTFQQTEDAHELALSLYQSLIELEREKQAHWEEKRSVLVARPMYNTGRFFRARRSAPRPEDAMCILSLVLQYHYFLPRRGCEVYLAGAADIVTAIEGPGELKLPKDPRPFPFRYDLEPDLRTYISCPLCHCLYSYNRLQRPLPPRKCTFQKTPGSQRCNADLWSDTFAGPRGTITNPIRLFHHQGLKSWLGRLLCRPGLEEILYDYPRAQLRPTQTPREAEDIWQGDVFRSFRGAPCEQPFFPGPDGELRLAFSLSIDSFSPFQNKTAKQSASSTGIWMVCLNLPPHLRYLPQNVYLVGVIPGPHKPANDQINHYVQLVVNDLKELWGPGVWFTRTRAKPGGRLCRGALIPLVCDLLAAHQTIGYPGAPTAHYFCTVCDLDIDDINFLSQDQWPNKDVNHIRRYASIYRTASSEAAQQAIFDGCGWRWSPLFELPYWDPTLFTVIDSMHSLDLNLLKNHVRNLFQIDFTLASGLAKRPATTSREKRILDDKTELRALRNCQHLIYENPPHLLYELLAFHRKVLYSFCLDYGITQEGQDVVVGTRWILAKAIYRWRQHSSPSNLLFMGRYPLLSTTQTRILEQESESGPLQTDDEGHPDPDLLKLPALAPEDMTGNALNPPAPLPHQHPPLKPKAAANLLSQLATVVDDDSRVDAVYKSSTVTAQKLAYVCDLACIDRSGIDEHKTRTAKRELFDLLINAFRAQRPILQALKGRLALGLDTEATPSSAFLGMDVMEAVRKDMERTRLPSWITPVPRDWGTTSRGKLSADNWRTICCVHLPITLVRIHGSLDGSHREKSLLDNFMQLVTAVRLATMTKTSPESIKAYDDAIFSYTKDALALYPDYSVLPSHHAALHIGDMLRRFGPKHAHDSPYYERFILFFHQMNTNRKLGQLEGTLLRTAVRHSNVLALLADSQEIQGLVGNLFDRMKLHKKERLRGYRLAEALDPFKPPTATDAGTQGEGVGTASEGTLDAHVLESLRRILYPFPTQRDAEMAPDATFYDALSFSGITYGTSTSLRYRDSSVLYQDGDVQKAGVIDAIFSYKHRPHRDETRGGQPQELYYLLVHEYTPVARHKDPYIQYGYAGGFCCVRPLNTEEGSSKVVPLTSLISHVVTTEIDDDVIHILPVNRTLLSAEIRSYTEGFDIRPPAPAEVGASNSNSSGG